MLTAACMEEPTSLGSILLCSGKSLAVALVAKGPEPPGEEFPVCPMRAVPFCMDYVKAQWITEQKNGFHSEQGDRGNRKERSMFQSLLRAMFMCFILNHP